MLNLTVTNQQPSAEPQGFQLPVVHLLEGPTAFRRSAYNVVKDYAEHYVDLLLSKP